VCRCSVAHGLQIEELFKKLDANRSGDITILELRASLADIQAILTTKLPIRQMVAALTKVLTV